MVHYTDTLIVVCTSVMKIKTVIHYNNFVIKQNDNSCVITLALETSHASSLHCVVLVAACGGG